MAAKHHSFISTLPPPISTFGCAGYKAFDRSVRLPVGGLTVLFGKNNSGKTSLLRLPLVATELLRSALSEQQDETRRTQELFRRHANSNAAHASMAVSVGWADGPSVTAEFLLLASPRSGSQVVLERLDIPDAGTFMAEPDLAEAGLPASVDEALRAASDDVAARAQAAFEGAMHITSARPGLAEVYSDRVATSWTVEEAPYLLKQHDTLLSETATWFRDGYEGLTLEVDSGVFAFRLLAGHTKRGLVNATDSGRGTQSVLPLATLLTAVRLGMTTPSLILLEEPEAHLHPSVHGSLAHLLLPAAEKVPVIVETHSENLLLRLRREIARGKVDPAQIHFAYIGSEGLVEPIEVDGSGAVSNWPEGVFEYDILEAEEIIEARLTANPALRER